MLTAAEFSALPKKKQKQQRSTWMRVHGVCYTFVRTGKCKHGKDCKFDHVKLPESMRLPTKKGAKEKKQKKQTSSSSSTSSTKINAAEVAKMVAVEIKKANKAKALQASKIGRAHV